MPHVDVNGTAIWWESRGTGAPVLLINGLTSSSDAWYRVVPHLVADHQVITMDNRGVGRSDAPKGRYTVTTMARDAIRVLDAAGLATAHIVGISMGSCIAQEMAAVAPERITSLTLASSNPGTRHSKLPALKVVGLLMMASYRDYSSVMRRLIPYTFHPSTSRERVEEDMRAVRAEAPTKRGIKGQTRGSIGWDRYADLPKIAAPTLVLHGAEDLLDPVVNGETLAARIPNAKLVVLPSCSHQIFTDQEDAAVTAVRDFVASVTV